MKNRSLFHFNIFFGLLLLAVGTMPFTKFLLLPILLLMFLNYVFEWNWKEKRQHIKNNALCGYTILFTSLFLCYVAGLLYTSNYSDALSNLEGKLALFIAPLAIFSANPKHFTARKVNQLFILFIVSCSLLVLTNLSISLVQYLKTGEITQFFYINLSHFMHPSYGAMYITVALTLSVYFLFFSSLKMNRLLKTGLWVSIPFYVLYIFLLQSKAGILVFGLLIFVLCLYLINYQKRRIILSFLFVGLMIFAAWLLIFKVSSPENRLRQAIETLRSNERLQSSWDGTLQRVAVWQAASDLSIENLPFGVGTGDVKDVLLERYKQEKLTIILNKKLNAHNQYLQTFLGLGIPGLLLLLSFLLVPFSLAWKKKKKNFPYMAFILIVLLNFLVESMLETRAGTNFIALFNCLFAYLINKPEIQAPSPEEIQS